MKKIVSLHDPEKCVNTGGVRGTVRRGTATYKQSYK